MTSRAGRVPGPDGGGRGGCLPCPRPLWFPAAATGPQAQPGVGVLPVLRALPPPAHSPAHPRRHARGGQAAPPGQVRPPWPCWGASWGRGASRLHRGLCRGPWGEGAPSSGPTSPWRGPPGCPLTQGLYKRWASGGPSTETRGWAVRGLPRPCVTLNASSGRSSLSKARVWRWGGCSGQTQPSLCPRAPCARPEQRPEERGTGAGQGASGSRAAGRAERLGAPGARAVAGLLPERGPGGPGLWPGGAPPAGVRPRCPDEGRKHAEGGAAPYLGPALGLAPPPWSGTCGLRATLARCPAALPPMGEGRGGGLAGLPRRDCVVPTGCPPGGSARPPPVPSQRDAGEPREGAGQAWLPPPPTSTGRRSARTARPPAKGPGQGEASTHLGLLRRNARGHHHLVRDSRGTAGSEAPSHTPRGPAGSAPSPGCLPALQAPPPLSAGPRPHLSAGPAHPGPRPPHHPRARHAG